MTTRRSFFGWIAGAAAAPALARDAMASGGVGGHIKGLGGLRILGQGSNFREISVFPESTMNAERLAELQEAWVRHSLREAFDESSPPPLRAPHHFVRARALRLRGMPEHIARQKRPQRRGRA
jgi:hypothetical protein